MATKIDPAIAQMFAQNVRAQVIASSGGMKLDPQIVEKIATRVPIFSGMTSDALMTTLADGETFPLKAGNPVFREGDLGSAFYVVLAGEVVVQKVRDGEIFELARLGPGECFGEMALVRNDVRTATVFAEKDCMTLRFERERVDDSPQSAYFIYRNIARILASRLDESSVMLADLVFQHKNITGFTPL